MAKQPNENKDTPNVNLLKIQQELEELAKEVLAMEGKGFFAKLGLGKKTKEVTPATGTDILEIAFLRGDKEINKLVSQLSGDPQNQAIRMQMVGRALQMEGRPQLEVARALLIHSCLPFYWGEVTGPAVQMLLRAFKLYLERILQIHKEKMEMMMVNGTIYGIKLLKKVNVRRLWRLLIEDILISVWNQLSKLLTVLPILVKRLHNR